ncbi:porin family protein [Flagellimonas zhangzhouensis]|uniref:Outer membrane protein beta-barrel domain-containing protein n=1 Tax=Flagellimonas zhangzhouensis TaxID=1073328 RepID=A0A1H2WV28_9FLAO|nr:porin family protein [Allomuricauda zhangzhouensis]SDQ25118.1 Outer membrane protein beta-barrel domain-containing protein [Allomuricauda zhangzhouensis]SDW84421.1 Outer membrane protein beta-barrel domain-containing protein [Allomuricauda zhangzhouensis]
MKYSVLKYLFIFCFLGVGFTAYAQVEQDSVQLDTRYLEDQFYFGVGYNILMNRPDGVVQRNLSYNLQAGFMKDIPFNKRRNFGIGLGVGYAVNSYYSNVVATETNSVVSYEIMDQSMFNRSKFELHSLEIPFEIRWRTSTAEDYKFWRIYAGVKLGYVFSGTSKVVTDDGNHKFSNNDIEDFQYGLTFNFGYNTWNMHAYYGLKSLLEDGVALDSGAPLDFQVLRIGLIFYIL